MTEVCRTDNFVAKCYDNPDNETYPVTQYSNGECKKLDLPLYNIIKIHKADTDEVIFTFKECRRGPMNPFRKFVKINGVQWFIGALNFKKRCFFNCETGKYVEAKEEFETWHNIRSMSPNSKMAIIYTYVYGGNTEYIRLYDFSQLETAGPIVKHIKNLPAIFDVSYPELYTFYFENDTEVRAEYRLDYEDDEWHDMGVFKIAE